MNLKDTFQIVNDAWKKYKYFHENPPYDFPTWKRCLYEFYTVKNPSKFNSMISQAFVTALIDEFDPKRKYKEARLEVLGPLDRDDLPF